MVRRILDFFQNESPRFRLFYDHENDFFRIAAGQFFAALIVAPLFTYIMHRSGAHIVYINNGLIYSFSWPILVGAFYVIKTWRPWLIYAFIAEFFVLTIIAFNHLSLTGFKQDEFIFFFLFFIICSISIQRLYPAILYQLLVLGLLLANHEMLDKGEIEPFLVVGMFLIVGLAMITAVYLRRQLLQSITTYIQYLRKIMSNPDSGYVLFRIDRSIIVDSSNDVARIFNIEPEQINDTFFSVFSDKDQLQILELKQGQQFKKQLSLPRFQSRVYVEVKVVKIEVNNDQLHLATIMNVTDEVLKRDELQVKEKRYRNLYFRNKAGVFTLNNQTNIIEGNDAFFRMFENSIQKGDLLFDLDDYADWQLILEGLRSSKKAQSYQTQYILKSGSRKTFVFSWYIDEQTGYIEGSVIDLTTIEKATQALKESEEKYRSIYEESNDAIVLLDGDRIMDANRRTEEFFGLSNSELLTRNLFDLSFDSDVNLEKKYHREKARLASSRSIRFNWLFDGADSVIEAEVSLVEVMIGNKMFYQCVIHDITEQNKFAKEQLRAELAEETNVKLAAEIQERINAETKLQEQFLRTRAIFESSSNTLLLTARTDGSIAFFNSHCHNYFQSNFGIVLEKDKNFFDYLESIASPRRKRMLRMVFTKVNEGASRQFEVRLGDDNEAFWLELFVNPIFNTEGGVGEISLVAHDISEKKFSSIEIEESLKEKEVLLKEIHHRVKNNLQVISSILNLQSSFVTDENTLGILQESRNRIRSMAIIHENLYRTEDFSSIKFDNYLKNLTANLIASYSVNRRIYLDADLHDVDLVLDQAIPCGLLTNELITNSLKYAWDEGEQEGKITLRLTQKGNLTELTIGDNGKGLPDDFEKMQSDTLGLQLVATLAEQLDAKLIVNNQKGAQYTIQFENVKPRAILPK